jgi:hypothetical protein
MYEDCRNELRRVRGLLVERDTNPRVILLFEEADVRLQQLSFLYQSVRACASEHLDVQRRWLATHPRTREEDGSDTIEVPPEEERKADYLAFQVRLYTECFYLLAGRLRELLRKGKLPIPGAKSFESAGVRDVRNKLLQHPEGIDSRVFSQSIMFGPEYGPVLKPIRDRERSNVFVDAGLDVNAAQLHDALMRLFAGASKLPT